MNPNYGNNQGYNQGYNPGYNQAYNPNPNQGHTQGYNYGQQVQGSGKPMYNQASVNMGYNQGGQGYMAQGQVVSNQGYGNSHQIGSTQGYSNPNTGNCVSGYANQGQTYNPQGSGNSMQYGNPIYSSGGGQMNYQANTSHAKAVQGQQDSLFTAKSVNATGGNYYQGMNQQTGGMTTSTPIVTGMVVGGTAPSGTVQVGATPIEVPQEYFDTYFTKQLFNDPAKTPDGFNYEREDLLQFIAVKKHDPISFNYLEESYLEKNLALKQKIEGWLLGLKVDVLVGNPNVLALIQKWIEARGRDNLRENERLCKVVETYDNTMKLRGGQWVSFLS